MRLYFFFSDKDECREYDVCGNGTCINSLGAFECSCNVGFEPGPHEKCVGKFLEIY